MANRVRSSLLYLQRSLQECHLLRVQDVSPMAHQLIVIGIHNFHLFWLAQSRVPSHDHIRRTICVFGRDAEEHRRWSDVVEMRYRQGNG